MWLTKPLYEALPFAYMGVGAVCLIASTVVEPAPWPLVLTIFGLSAVIGGLVVWLKRRDYRTSRSRTAFDDRL